MHSFPLIIASAIIPVRDKPSFHKIRNGDAPNEACRAESVNRKVKRAPVFAVFCPENHQNAPEHGQLDVVKPGRKRWWLPALVVAGIAVALYCHHSGPSYKGKSAGYWFYRENDYDSAKAFQAMGSTAIPYLLEQLKSNDPGSSALYIKYWQKLPGIFQTLLPEPRGPDVRRSRAAFLLGTIGSAAQPAVPDLIAAYNRIYLKEQKLPENTPVDWTREFTNSSASSAIARPGNGIVRRTIISTRRNGVLVRRNLSLTEDSFQKSILTALASIGGEDKDIVALILLNGSDTVNVTNLAPAIKRSEPILLIAIKDPDAGVRATAANMLGPLAPDHPEVIGPLLKALDDEETGVYLNAVSSLGNTRAESGIVVPALCRMLDNLFAYPKVVEALANVGAGDEKARSLLNELLGDPDPRIRAGAAEALGMVGPPAKSALPKLAELTDASKEDKQVRYCAAGALWKIAGQANAIIPFRLEALRDKDAGVRRNAIRCLGEYGALARSAVPALKPFLKDEDAGVRNAATDALKKIEPKEGAK